MSYEEEEYQVEAIRKWRYNLGLKTREFFIKWVGYPDEQNTWEPEDNLTHCPEILEKFINGMSKEQTKFFYAERPDKLTGFQRNAEYTKYVGTDGPHGADDEHAFYILTKFDDSSSPEELTLHELYKNEPDEALRFCEERLLLHGKSTRQDQNTPPSSSRSLD